jgi:hypothetical protein
VKDYFKTITKPSNRKNIFELVERLERPVIAEEADLKDLYYKENA